MAESSESTTTTTTQPDGGTPNAGEGGTPETFGAWLGKQDDATKALIEQHTSGLKTSLESERNDRKSLGAQLKALQAEGDPVKQKEQIAQLQASIAEAEARAAFAEDAHTQGVTNIKLAYLAAKDADLLGKRDLWEKMRASAPELFRKPTAAAAGNGSGVAPMGALTMNDIIRGHRGVQ